MTRSLKAQSSATGGNAYPSGDVDGYTISGLGAGVYRVWVRAGYGPGDSGPWSKSDQVVVAASDSVSGAASDSVAQARSTADPPESDPPPPPQVDLPQVFVFDEQADEEDLLVAEPQQEADDVCGTIEIVEAEARNTHVGVFFDTPGRTATCTEQFSLFYDEGDGAWVEALSGVSSQNTYSVACPCPTVPIPGQTNADGTPAMRYARRYLALSKPETTVVYKVKVASGACDTDNKNCAREAEVSSDTANSSFKLHYRSLSNHSDASRGSSLGSLVTSTTSTGGLLLPSEEESIVVDGTRDPDDGPIEDIEVEVSGFRSYIYGDPETLVADSTNTADRHLYRVPMTAGRTYTFHEGGTRLLYMFERYQAYNGDDQFTYILDEHRITLYKLNDRGELEAIPGYEQLPEAPTEFPTAPPSTQICASDVPSCDQFPKNGWQIVPGEFIDGRLRRFSDPDYRPLNNDIRTDSDFTFDLVDVNGNKYTYEVPLDIPAPGANASYDWAEWLYYGAYQLRMVEFTPTESDIYYLAVTRITDNTFTEHTGGGWFLLPHRPVLVQHRWRRCR